MLKQLNERVAASSDAVTISTSLPLRVPRGPGPSLLRRDLGASTADAASYNLMVGLGETYLPAYVLALGMGDTVAGLMATAPMMLGAVCQLISPWAVARVGSHRRWIVWCARVQAMSLLLLPLAAWRRGPAVVLIAATLYWASGMATGPAWNTWIENIVPRRVLTRFFAWRVRVGQAFVLLGFLLGGAVLQGGQRSVDPAITFGALFCAAAAARFFSAWCLAGQSEFLELDPGHEQATTWVVLRNWSRGGYGRLVTYFLFMNSAVYIAAPFFAPFMLSSLKLSYLQYALLIGLGYVGKVLALPFWGRFAHRHGAWKLLWLGACGIVPLSACWLASQSVWFLALLQIVGGVMWGAHELAMFVLFIEVIPRRERTVALTAYNLGNAAAMLGGSLLGALLLRTCGGSAATFFMLFGLSSLVRAACVVFLARTPRVATAADAPLTRTIAVRPATASIEQPILAGCPDAA